MDFAAVEAAIGGLIDAAVGVEVFAGSLICDLSAAAALELAAETAADLVAAVLVAPELDLAAGWLERTAAAAVVVEGNEAAGTAAATAEAEFAAIELDSAAADDAPPTATAGEGPEMTARALWGFWLPCAAVVCADARVGAGVTAAEAEGAARRAAAGETERCACVTFRRHSEPTGGRRAQSDAGR